MSAIDKKLPKKELDDQLENALEDTFPASDPVSIGQPTSHKADRPAHRQAPEFNKALINDLAKRAAKRRNRKNV